MALDPRRVKALFNAALDLPDPADRPAFLDRECGDDPELRRRLDELLAAYDQPASALERPLAADPGETSAPDEPPAVDRRRTGGRSGSDGKLPAGEPAAGFAHRHASSRAGTSSARRSAKGAWAASTSPSRPSRSSGRSR